MGVLVRCSGSRPAPGGSATASADATGRHGDGSGYVAGAIAAFLVGAGPASAEPVTLGGITFSDERCGFVIRGGRGSGTVEDPFVVVEEIDDDGPAVLVIRGLDEVAAGGGLGGGPVGGFALVKEVTNATGEAWSSFELELREDLRHPSTYEDGLSFAQALPDLRRFTADRFRTVRRIDEPLDAIEFGDGVVRPGETVRLTLTITDYTPVPEFYLLQQREGNIARLGREHRPAG